MEDTDRTNALKENLEDSRCLLPAGDQATIL